MTGFMGTPAGGSAATSPSATRSFFMKLHATTSNMQEKEQIEMLAGPDFTFDVLTDNEMSSVADGMKGDQPTVQEAGEASIDEMAQAREDAREIDQANDEKLRKEKAEETQRLLSQRSVGQVQPGSDQGVAFGSSMTRRGSGIGTEFSRRR